MSKFCFIFALLATPFIASAQLKIMTTTTDYADIAKQIGGDKVDVHSVMKGPENVHNVMAKPTEMVFLNKADIFVHSGLDAEPWRDNLLKGARNPRVIPGKPGNVDMSEGIELKEVPAGKIDRSMGDVHAYGNPHYTANIVTAIEPKPAITPSPAEMRKTIDIMRQQNVKIVIVETYNSSDQAKSIADAVGAQVITLPDHVLGVPQADSYQHLFTYDIARLIEAAKAAGIEPKTGSADAH